MGTNSMPNDQDIQRSGLRFGLRFMFAVTILTAMFLFGWISHNRFERWQASQLATANADAAQLEALETTFRELTKSLLKNRQAVIDAQSELQGDDTGDQLRIKFLVEEKERAEELLASVNERISQLSQRSAAVKRP